VEVVLELYSLVIKIFWFIDKTLKAYPIFFSNLKLAKLFLDGYKVLEKIQDRKDRVT